MATAAKPRANSRRSRSVLANRSKEAPHWRRYFSALGPGLVTGASDDDPSGIATYAQAGAKAGLGLVWTALVTLPLMMTVQEMCDRTALVTGKGLGELVVKRFAQSWRHVIAVLLASLMVANTLNIAADLVAVGDGMHLLNAGAASIWAPAAGVALTGLLMSGSFHLIARVFKLLTLALVSYLVVLFLSHPRWGTVMVHTLLPHMRLSRDYLALLVAVLGTTISPYLFFWQSAHRMEDLRDEAKGGHHHMRLKDRPGRAARRKLAMSRLDVFSGMAFSNLVMFAIMVVTAQTLARHGQHDIHSAAQAASALRPLAGHFSETLFALGFIGTGMLTVPVLAGSGAAGMAGLMRRSWGFSRSPRRAPVFYALVAAGTLGGTLLTLLRVNPIHLLVLVALINGVAAAPFLIVVLLVANHSKLMGNRTNGHASNTMGWLTVALMTAAAASLLFTLGH